MSNCRSALEQARKENERLKLLLARLKHLVPKTFEMAEKRGEP